MAEVTNELMYELLKKIQGDLAAEKESLREINAGLNALRTQMIAVHQDIQNIYLILARHDTRLERIERRLDIVEPA